MVQDTSFEKLEGGGSLILAWRLKDLNCLVLGGGFVAASRVQSLIQADAKITLICPIDELNDELKHRINQNEVVHLDRVFLKSDLEDNKIAMVLSEENSESDLVYLECKLKNIPVNIADKLSQCDFWFMSTYRDGPLQVAVSSNSKAPRLAKNLRLNIASIIPNFYGKSIDNFGKIRELVKIKQPGFENGSKRMKWLIKLADSWNVEDFSKLNDSLIERLMDNYGKDEIPLLNELIDIKNRGTITLVGAGPGDPDLLTVKALNLIKHSDLIVSDRLVSKEILDLIPKHKLKVALPKKEGISDSVQSQLNEICLNGLKQGLNVIRLKIGDPLIFGRGGEEINFYKSNGYDPIVIPGISSILSAPIASNFPLTFRSVSDQLFISSGNLKGGKLPNLPIYSNTLTLCLLMAVNKGKQLKQNLLNLNYPSNLPCCFIENYSNFNERVIKFKLSEIDIIQEKENVQPPACLYIGKICHFPEIDPIEYDIENEYIEPTTEANSCNIM